MGWYWRHHVFMCNALCLNVVVKCILLVPPVPMLFAEFHFPSGNRSYRAHLITPRVTKPNLSCWFLTVTTNSSTWDQMDMSFLCFCCHVPQSPALDAVILGGDHFWGALHHFQRGMKTKRCRIGVADYCLTTWGKIGSDNLQLSFIHPSPLLPVLLLLVLLLLLLRLILLSVCWFITKLLAKCLTNSSYWSSH